MLIGILQINFRLHGITSLKTKRKISNSLKQKLKNKFNVAVAEIGYQDNLNHLQIGMVTLANQKNRVEEILGKALAMVEAVSTDEIIDVTTDIFGA
ncbi:DUF503 domain-containing protein [Desulfonatronovibrio hydrogenovorans]|uniref:DUF503 domain-containing protein n=1 Tax=Desulfonatronovibrio hydrogenovorans TaxID=53245 RepID=UPI00048AB0C5|nr:DUF503 domain-containing protein [Desulfonatronovibrio hydrogenovorans]